MDYDAFVVMCLESIYGVELKLRWNKKKSSSVIRNNVLNWFIGYFGYFIQLKAMKRVLQELNASTNEFRVSR